MDDLRYIRKLKNHGIQITQHEEAVQTFLQASVENNRGKSIEIIKTTDRLGWYIHESENTFEFVPYLKLMETWNMEKPLSVLESAIIAWENKRTIAPSTIIREATKEMYRWKRRR